MFKTVSVTWQGIEALRHVVVALFPAALIPWLSNIIGTSSHGRGMHARSTLMAAGPLGVRLHCAGRMG